MTTFKYCMICNNWLDHPCLPGDCNCCGTTDEKCIEYFADCEWCEEVIEVKSMSQSDLDEAKDRYYHRERQQEIDRKLEQIHQQIINEQ